MVALSFSDMSFVEQIRNGTKQQTIRVFRTGKYCQLRDNETLQLYFRQRSPAGFKICDAKKTDLFIIHLSPLEVLYRSGDAPLADLQNLDADEFARRDGFNSYSELVEWFRKSEPIHKLPNLFYVVRWGGA